MYIDGSNCVQVYIWWSINSSISIPLFLYSSLISASLLFLFLLLSFIYIYVCECIHIYKQCHTHTHTYIYIYIYMCVCVCVDVCAIFCVCFCARLNLINEFLFRIRKLSIWCHCCTWEYGWSFKLSQRVEIYEKISDSATAFHYSSHDRPWYSSLIPHAWHISIIEVPKLLEVLDTYLRYLSILLTC